MGTAFLACPESGISQVWQDQLCAASATRTTVTTAMSGRPARGLRNRYIEEMEATLELLPYPLQYAMSARIRQESTRQGNADFPAMWSGQGVGLLADTLPAADLMKRLIQESESLLATLSDSTEF